MAKDPVDGLGKQLSKIIEPALPESEESKRAGRADETAYLEQLEIDKKREELRGFGQDIDERKKYAKKSFKLVTRWLIGVFFLLLFQGFLSTNEYVTFKLPESVLIAVVGGTTASIIGIFVVVANYLFPKR